MVRLLLLLLSLLALWGAGQVNDAPASEAGGDVSASDDGGPTPPPSPAP